MKKMQTSEDGYDNISSRIIQSKFISPIRARINFHSKDNKMSSKNKNDVLS